MKYKPLVLNGVIGILAITFCFTAFSHPEKDLTPEEMSSLAKQAYIFGYPLVLMDVTRQVMTAVPKVDEKHAPMNQFLHMSKFPTPLDKEVVSPNADTLYSTAWLDLSREPIILSVPDTHGRYYLMQMLDAWTDVFASPGSRTTGTGKGDFAITGPNWKGALPSGVRELRSPTSIVWIIGRTQTNGKEDYDAVHEIQKQYLLTPLSAWGNGNYTPPDHVPVTARVDTKTPPVEQVARMNALAFFNRLCTLMKNNPPNPADSGTIDDIDAIGVEPGGELGPKNLTPPMVSNLEEGRRLALGKIAIEAKSPASSKIVNGWLLNYNLGRYGTNYLLRAGIAMVGLGANLPEDAIYPMARIDGDSHPLTGANRYIIHFSKNEIPPVRGFWSVTMYNDRQFFVANPIDRYAIGDRDKLQFNQDGSLDLYVQHTSPGSSKENNWLPSSDGPFNLIMRLYWPRQEVLSGNWSPPPIQPIKPLQPTGR